MSEQIRKIEPTTAEKIYKFKLLPATNISKKKIAKYPANLFAPLSLNLS